MLYWIIFYFRFLKYIFLTFPPNIILYPTQNIKLSRSYFKPDLQTKPNRKWFIILTLFQGQIWNTERCPAHQSPDWKKSRDCQKMEANKCVEIKFYRAHTPSYGLYFDDIETSHVKYTAGWCFWVMFFVNISEAKKVWLFGSDYTGLGQNRNKI